MQETRRYVHIGYRYCPVPTALRATSVDGVRGVPTDILVILWSLVAHAGREGMSILDIGIVLCQLPQGLPW